jgi:hypothetical protein
VVGAAVGVLAALIGGVYLYDHSRRDLIAPGVRVGGIYVGALRAGAARARLQGALRASEARWITVRYRSESFTLTGGQAHLSADVAGAVQEAVRISRRGSIVSRTIDGLFGNHLDRSVPMRVSFSHSAVAGLLARIEASVHRPARDATVAVSRQPRLVEVPGQRGVGVLTSQLRAELGRALSHPAAAQVLRVPVHALDPRVTTATLPARYPAYIVVDRPVFKLFFYRHLHLEHTYPIAVGRAGLETPAGLHHILDKEVNPSWHVPHSAWAGALAGHVIPPGPEDPLVARWMAIDELGDGIHGTNEPESIGGAASHGCIRMLVPDVIQLYSATPIGTPVYVI